MGHHRGADDAEQRVEQQDWPDADAQAKRQRSNERRRDTAQPSDAGMGCLIARAVFVRHTRH